MSANTCRVCLESNATIPIFATAESKNFSVKIMECAQISLSATDGYPDKICDKCCSDLNISYGFINKCKDSDKQLRSQIDLIKIETTDPIKLEPDACDDFVCEKSDVNDSDYKDKDDLLDLSDSDKDFDTILSTYLLKDSKKKVKLKKASHYKADQPCTVCGLRVASSSALRIHLRTHTGEKPFKCAMCAKSFALKSTLQEHELRLHSNAEKNITCESCGKQFHKERDLVVHMRVHTKEMPYLCPHCPARFSQHASIIKHIRTHTGERPYKCKICGRAFSSQSHVKSHETSHSDLRPFKCATCGKAMKNKHSLTQHMKRHRGSKDFICDQCGSTFTTKGNLVVHMTTIHSEKSGICHICSKTCSNLENHIKMHTGELLFECQYCKKKFRKCNLSNHLMKHTNAGKYRCEVDKCFKSFSTKNLLDFHFLKHHLKTPQYTCNCCFKRFYRPCDLATHVRRSHGNKITNE